MRRKAEAKLILPFHFCGLSKMDLSRRCREREMRRYFFTQTKTLINERH